MQAAHLRAVPTGAERKRERDRQMPLAADHCDATLATGRKRSGADRCHLALQHEREDIPRRHRGPALLLARLDDEAIRLEADMRSARDLEDPF